MRNTGEVKFWLTDKELKSIFSSNYWNDEEKEKGKEWSLPSEYSGEVPHGGKDRIVCFKEFESITAFAAKVGLPIQGTGVDLAAGVCWTSALLSKIEAVEKVYALDISKHRILKMAPAILDMLLADAQKIVRVIGSFYDIKLPDASVDFCLISRAFHHANDPDGLLREAKRVLKPGGFIMISGEKPVFMWDYTKKYVKNIIKMIVPRSLLGRGPAVYRLFPSFEELFPPDTELGDHYYRMQDYENMFLRNGFLLHVNRSSGIIDFIAVKK